MNAHAGAEQSPSWRRQDLYPFESDYAEIAGARVGRSPIRHAGLLRASWGAGWAST